MAETKGKTILEHAAYELVKAGLTDSPDPEARQVALNTMALVKRLQNQNNNGKQFEYVVRAFSLLAQRQPLAPITDDPEEWEKFEIEKKNIDAGTTEKEIVWQSRRMPSLFSKDEGKTFTDHRTGETGTAVDHKEWEAQAAKEKDDEQKRQDAMRSSKKAKTSEPLQPEDTKTEEAPQTEAPAAEEKAAEEPKTEGTEEAK